MACAAIVNFFCFAASTIYHTYFPLSDHMYHLLLKFDLIGIGFNIFGLTLCAVWIGFHNWPFYRNLSMATMTFLLLANILFQMTPCYTR